MALGGSAQVRRSGANCVRDPAVRNHGNKGHEAGLRRLDWGVDADPEPAVGGELCSLSSNEEHEAGLRRLERGGAEVCCGNYWSLA